MPMRTVYAKSHLTLRQWLEQNELWHLLDNPIEVDEDELARLIEECKNLHPNYGDEERFAWAVYSIAARVPVSREEQEAIGPSATAALARNAVAYEKQTAEMRAMTKAIADFDEQIEKASRAVTEVAMKSLDSVKDQLFIMQGAILASSTLTRERVDIGSASIADEIRKLAAATLRENEIRAKAERAREIRNWVWRFIVILAIGLLIGVVSTHAQPRIRLQLPLFTQDPAGGGRDPASQNMTLRWQDEGSNISGAVFRSGLYIINCTGAGLACSYNTTTRTLTINGSGGGGGGTTITVNGSALAATSADLDDATPAAPADGLNVKFQKDALTPTNISAYIPMLSITKVGTLIGGTWNASTIGLAYGGTNQTAWTASRCVQVNAGGTALESAAAACGAGGGTHDILSATHSDTTAAAVARGAGMFGIGATPKWTRVDLTTTDRYWKRNSSGDVVESSSAASGVGTPTACTNQFLRTFTLNADAAPTLGSGCATVTSADVDSSIVTAASTHTFTNKTYDVEGTGNVFTDVGKLWLPAAECDDTAPVALWQRFTSLKPLATCDTGTNTQKAYLDFPDGDGLYQIQTSFPLPSDWTGSIDIKLFWKGSLTTGDVEWKLAGKCVADAETEDPAFNASVDTADTAKGTANQMNTMTATLTTSDTLSGCAGGEILFLKLARDRTDTQDTWGAAPPRFRGIEVTYRRAK